MYRFVISSEQTEKTITELVKEWNKMTNIFITLDDSIIIIDGNIVPFEYLETTVVKENQVVEVIRLVCGG